GPADRPRRRRPPHPLGQLAVGNRFAVGNLLQRRPYLDLEGSSVQLEVEVELCPSALEVLGELLGGFGEGGAVLLPLRRRARAAAVAGDIDAGQDSGLP